MYFPFPAAASRTIIIHPEPFIISNANFIHSADVAGAMALPGRPGAPCSPLAFKILAFLAFLALNNEWVLSRFSRSCRPVRYAWMLSRIPYARRRRPAHALQQINAWPPLRFLHPFEHLDFLHNVI